MQKTPISRKRGLRVDPQKVREWKARQKPLERKKRLNPRNDERREHLFERQFHSKEYVAFVHAQPCAVPGCRDRNIQCAHVVHTRGAGGRWYHIAPLCAAHHAEQEGRSAAFEARYGIDLEDAAAALACRWKVQQQGHT